MEKDLPAIQDLITRYKDHVRVHGLKDEIYKWELLGKYSGRPNVLAEDLGAEIDAVDFRNLVYPFAITAMKAMVNARPDEYRSILRTLFDESLPLSERVAKFCKEGIKLHASIKTREKDGAHHDERTAATLLAYHDPDRYPLYKWTFYNELCKVLGIKPKSNFECYVHYQELIKDFLGHYILKDQPLIDLIKSKLPKDIFQDSNHLVLAQDILYIMLDKLRRKDRHLQLEEEAFETTVQEMKASSPLNQILYGPPGTGKTYNTINKALEILGVSYDPNNRLGMKRIFDEHLALGRIAFATFHQSLSYEDFVEGIKPLKPNEQEKIVRYDIQPGIFKLLCDKAILKKASNNLEDTYAQYTTDLLEAGGIELRTPVQGKPFTVKINSAKSSVAIPKTDAATEMIITKGMIIDYVLTGKIRDWKPYTVAIGNYFKSNYKFDVIDSDNSLLPHILIIDEINRGNVSQIFGELITLIEADKRAGAAEALSVTLPYSKESFSVPPNLYIIGTMNTADRSVEALDTALRRRFEFVEMPPRPDLVPETLEDAPDISPRDILYTINLRIEKLLDRDHQIGHACFMDIQTLDQLRRVFQHKLLPLLQEYFYGDYAKIGLVLGNGFIHLVNPNMNNAMDFFAEFYRTGYESDLMEKQVWHLANIEGMTDQSFLDALVKLKAKSYPAA